MDNEGGLPQDAAVEQEKMLPQSQVNELIGAEKARALERGRREAEAQYQAELAKLKASTPDSIGGMQQLPNIDQIGEQVFNRVMEQAQRHQQEAEEAQRRAQAEQLASDYYNKVNGVKDKYPDFDAVMSDFKPSAFPEIVSLVHNLDNAGDVMYELVRNPGKLSSVLNLAQRDPNLALKELHNIGKSITVNEDALANYRDVPSPLSRPKPSTAGVESGGLKSLADFKNADWLRG